MPVWSPGQGFIQPVLLTSVFHEELSFMALGYSFVTQQVSVRWPLLLVGHMGCCKPPMWGNFDYFNDSSFLNSLSMHHSKT